MATKTAATIRHKRFEKPITLNRAEPLGEGSVSQSPVPGNIEILYSHIISIAGHPRVANYPNW
jgi:hypothetical protein